MLILKCIVKILIWKYMYECNYINYNDYNQALLFTFIDNAN
jgi:hypothetical protein